MLSDLGKDLVRGRRSEDTFLDFPAKNRGLGVTPLLGMELCAIVPISQQSERGYLESPRQMHGQRAIRNYEVSPRNEGCRLTNRALSAEVVDSSGRGEGGINSYPLEIFGTADYG